MKARSEATSACAGAQAVLLAAQDSAARSGESGIRYTLPLKFRQSLEGKFASLAVLLVVFTGLLAGGVADLLDSPLGGPCAALILALPLTVYAVRRFMRPVNRPLTL